MTPPRVSMARLMGVVAILAGDCGLVRFGLDRRFLTGGLLTSGLVLSAGLIGVLLSRGVARRGWVGFMATFWLVWFLLGVGALHFQGVGRIQEAYFNGMGRWGPSFLGPPTAAPNGGVEIRDNPMYWLYMDVVAMLPPLLAALLGGVMTLAVSALRSPPQPRQNPT